MKVVSEGVEKFDDPEALCRIVEEIGCADKDRDMDRIFPDIMVGLLFNVPFCLVS